MLKNIFRYFFPQPPKPICEDDTIAFYTQYIDTIFENYDSKTVPKEETRNIRYMLDKMKNEVEKKQLKLMWTEAVEGTTTTFDVTLIPLELYESIFGSYRRR
jgi:hypothetical protein